MSIFKPTATAERITGINLSALSKLGVRVILLDVDNTVVSYRDKTPIDGCLEWVNEALKEGFELFIVSNNQRYERVKLVASQFSLPFEYLALKPLPKGFIRALRRTRCRREECIVIGDQIFTDILGANLAGMKSVLLAPIEEETGVSFKIRRKLEKGLREKYSKTVPDISE